MAIVLCGDRPATVISHSDRGTQYASAQITAFAAENGITRSMGSTGICWDNSMAESFLATPKTEFYYRRIWPTWPGQSETSRCGSRTATTVAVATPRSGMSRLWTSSCNTRHRPQRSNSPLNPCPLSGVKATPSVSFMTR